MMESRMTGFAWDGTHFFFCDCDNCASAQGIHFFLFFSFLCKDSTFAFALRLVICDL